MAMRSRRLIKKISKKLASFMRDPWVSEWNDDLYYKGKYLGHSKGIHHIGGEQDYWGEASDIYTVLEAAEGVFYSWASFCGCQSCQDQFDPCADTERCETTKRRLNLRPTFKNLKMALELEA